MINDIYMSYWSGRRSLAAAIPGAELNYWELSNRQANAFFPRVHLVTDTSGLQTLGHLDWASTSTALDSLPNDSPFWSWGKIRAIERAVQAGLPFLHIDHDVFLWKNLPEKFNSAGIIAQSDETFDRFPYPVKALLDEMPVTLNEFITALPETIRAYNCGIMGGNDMAFWAHYVSVVETMAGCKENKAWWAAAKKVLDDYRRDGTRSNLDACKLLATVIIEQFGLAAVAHFDAKPVTTLFTGSILSRRYDYIHLPKIGYTHLVNGKSLEKVHREVMNSLGNMTHTLAL